MDTSSERVLNIQCNDDDDADLEEYVEKSVRRFIGNSQSAHANLAQIASRSFPQRVRKHSSLSEEDEEEEADSSRAEEEDSDEEFYVHLALLPFRKSKSTAAGLVCPAALDSGQPSKTRRSYQPVNSQSMANFESRFQQRHSLAAEVGLLASHRPSIDVVWPEPDDRPNARRPSAHPTVDLRRGDVLRVDAEKTEETEDQMESCWSAPSHLSDVSASSSSSSLSNGLSDEESDGEFEDRVERVGRSWSAPPRIDVRPNSPIDGYPIRRMSNELFTVRPLNGSIVRSFSCDDVKRNWRRHQFWSNSCYALSVADENDEDKYLSDGESENMEERMRRSRAPSRSPVGSEHRSPLRRSPSFAVLSPYNPANDRITDEEEEKMDEEGDDDEFGVGRSAFSATDPSESELDDDFEEENAEEADEFTETLGATLLEFSARRRSQFFIPSHRMSQSKSDGQLGLRRSAPMFFRRPRTPCFGTSANDLSTNDPNSTIFQEFADVRIRHSETYHGTSNRFSAPGEFASELERRLAENEREKQKRAEETGVDELVESFAVEKEETEDQRRDSIERRRDSQFDRWIPEEEEEKEEKQNEEKTEKSEPIQQIPESTAEITDLPSQENLSVNSDVEIPMAQSDDEMAERRLIAEFFDRPDSLPDSWRLAAICVEQKLRTKSETEEVRIPEEMTAELVEAAVDEDRMSIRSVGGDLVGIPMADDDEPPLSPLRAPPPRRRRSPPIASEDELSDSEISELEKRLATGPADIDSEDEVKSVEFDANMPSQACQSPDIDVEMARRAFLAQMIPASSSMPAFPANLRERLNVAAKNAANLSADERAHLEETAQWLRKSQTQQNFTAIGAEPSGVMSRSMCGDLRRRLLPIRPDDPIAQTSRLPVASVPPLHVGRRLPALPEQDPMTNTQSLQPTAPPIQTIPQRPPLPSHPAFRPPPRGAIASQMGHAHDYQLSYGIDMSMMRSVTNYGMEDSYYEDGLNGNPHSPYERKTVPYSSAEDSSGISSFASSEQTPSYGPTHRVQFTFVPRHDDEVLLEIGDALRVDREYEDHWCYGTNLRTGHSGLFPAAHVCEIDLVDEIANSVLPGGVKAPIAERDTFYLTMLASIEVAHHKGNDVLVEAINKVCEMYQRKEEILVPQTVLMEISFRGVHVIDKRKKDFFRCPTFDYFYGLQNISFCGAHPKQLRYFGFITKHPLLPRFACHVFLSNESTQSIVESIGRAFKRSYDEYMAFAHPTEDIYIE